MKRNERILPFARQAGLAKLAFDRAETVEFLAKRICRDEPAEALAVDETFGPQRFERPPHR